MFGIKVAKPRHATLLSESITSTKAMADLLPFIQLAYSPFRPIWLWLKPRGLDKAMEVMRPNNVKAYLKFITSCITQRMKEQEDIQREVVDNTDVRKDMFHHIFQAKDPESGNLGYSKGELFSESDLLVIAG